MEQASRVRKVIIIDPIAESITDMHEIYTLVQNIVRGPRAPTQTVLQALEQGLKEADRKYIIYPRGHGFVKPVQYTRITELKTENPCTYLSISNCLYKGEKERIITIYINDIPKSYPWTDEQSKCLIA